MGRRNEVQCQAWWTVWRRCLALAMTSLKVTTMPHCTPLKALWHGQSHLQAYYARPGVALCSPVQRRSAVCGGEEHLHL